MTSISIGENLALFVRAPLISLSFHVSNFRIALCQPSWTSHHSTHFYLCNKILHNIYRLSIFVLADNIIAIRCNYWWRRFPSHPSILRAHTWFWRGAVVMPGQLYVYHHDEYDIDTTYHCRGIFGEHHRRLGFKGKPKRRLSDARQASVHPMYVSVSFFACFRTLSSFFYFCVGACFFAFWFCPSHFFMLWIAFPLLVFSFLTCSPSPLPVYSGP